MLYVADQRYISSKRALLYGESRPKEQGLQPGPKPEAQGERRDTACHRACALCPSVEGPSSADRAPLARLLPCQQQPVPRELL